MKGSIKDQTIRYMDYVVDVHNIVKAKRKSRNEKGENHGMKKAKVKEWKRRKSRNEIDGWRWHGYNWRVGGVWNANTGRI